MSLMVSDSINSPVLVNEPECAQKFSTESKAARLISAPYDKKVAAQTLAVIAEHAKLIVPCQ